MNEGAVMQKDRLDILADKAAAIGRRERECARDGDQKGRAECADQMSSLLAEAYGPIFEAHFLHFNGFYDEEITGQTVLRFF